MGRQKATVRINQFVGGINTEASPLNFPDGATISEQNADIQRDGSRKRRPGFDVHSTSPLIDTSVIKQEGRFVARNQFRWDNPGGIANKQFVVVQIGNFMGIHDIGDDEAPGPLLYSKTFPDKVYSKPLGFTSVDGLLVAASLDAKIYTFSYEDGTISESFGSLLIRDFFGVQDTYGNVELLDPANISLRPNNLTQPHIYNLRNQTFAIPRVDGITDTVDLHDPIDLFAVSAASLSSGSFWSTMWSTVFPTSGANPYPLSQLYPSNSDNVIRFYYPDANLVSNRLVERFNAQSMLQTPPSSARSPNGYFIINALNRGASRLTQIKKLYDSNTTLAHPVTILPTDKTPDGASVVETYSGRVWYAGFSGDVTDGDSNSPKLSSYVLFSQVVRSPNQVFNCYQEADPTSNEDSSIIDTDGGFIRLDGAYNIKAMIAVEASLFVFADNGVWRISGNDQNGFTATSFSVSKLSEEGCISGHSVTYTNLDILFWGYNGIFSCAKTNTGEWAVVSISSQSIQSLYKSIPTLAKRTAIGSYDSFEEKVKWVYGYMCENETSQELILNIRFKSFTQSVINNLQNSLGIMSISQGQKASTNFSPQTLYVVLVEGSTSFKYKFGGYLDENILRDWASFGGIDTPCFLITGSSTGGEARLKKDVPYLNTYFKITDGEELEGVASSCLVSSQWNWTNNSSAGKFSTPRQAYRPYTLSSGNVISKTRNKIRGFGNSVAFKFESEPDKTFQIYGWEFSLDATSEE
jgi:hypothetical protein